VVPKPWNKSYLAAVQSVSKQLYITNPTMPAVLNAWHNYHRYSLEAVAPPIINFPVQPTEVDWNKGSNGKQEGISFKRVS